ncbi:MAG: AI-2E family transporter [Alcanivorax sp.]|nr:AI-2E family transporter [Alcanivorax sp.]
MSEARASWPWIGILAALVVLVAGMRAASGLLEPFLLAVFLSIVCAPGVAWLRRHHVPEALAVLLVMIGLILAMIGVATGLGASINGFVRELPKYEEVLNERLAGALEMLAGFGMHLDTEVWREHLDAETLMNMAGKVAGHFGAALGNLLLVLLTVAFILLEAARFPAKLQAALGDAAPGVSVFRKFSAGVNQYLAIKSMVSLGTGILVTLWMWVLDVDYPLLWGALAFMFNYIPNIGSFLAAIPACLLAYVLHGFGLAAVAVAGFVAINTGMGNLLEPRLMGRRLGLSTLVVFVSLVFWGWVLGPVGMVLSVPLTMILRIAFESRAETRWLAVLLGPEVAPAEQSESQQAEERAESDDEEAAGRSR